MPTPETSEGIGQLGGWTELLAQLVKGNPFSEAQAHAFMSGVLEGGGFPTQIAGALCSMRTRGETPEELSGFVRAVYDAAVPFHLPDQEFNDSLIDTCGTGGDRAGTINVSTAAAFVVAAAGIPVCKHGNRAASSLSGTADVLDVLGVVVDHGAPEVLRCIEEVGIGFALAPRFHPAFRHATPIRKELGVPTAFNFIGPLCNPTRLRRQVIGVSDRRYAPVVADTLARRRAIRAMVVFGHDGLDELSICDTSTVIDVRDGNVTQYDIAPEEFGIERVELSALKGGEPRFNADRTRAILGGEFSAQSECVALNAAAGLVVGGQVDSLADGVNAAREILASGAALGVLDELIRVSQALPKGA